MRRRNFIILVIFILFFASSCASLGTKAPVWTTNSAESSKLVYGVGSARMTNEKNSRDASYGVALTDLVAKLFPVIEEAIAPYSSDMTVEAYRKITTAATSAIVSKAAREDGWTSPDGTVWTLVSSDVRDFPSLFEQACDEYIQALEEKRMATLEKLDSLIASLEVEKNSDGAVILTPDAILLKEKAEKKADEIISEIDRVESSLRIEEVVKRIRSGLQKRGYAVN